MVSPRWVLLILVIFFVGALFSSIIEQTYYGTTETSKISQLVDQKTPIWDKAWILWEISWFDFAMFKNADGTGNELMPLRWCLIFVSISFWFTIFMSIGTGVTKVVTKLMGLV